MPEGHSPLKSLAATLGAGCLLIVSLVGCGLTSKQKLALTSFSRSVVTLGEATSAEMQVFRADGIQANVQVLLLRGETVTPGLPKLASLDRGYELSRVQPVIRAADALAAYGKTLAALTGNTQADDLKKAGMDFMQSLSQLPEAKDLGQAQFDAFGTVIQEVGGLWVGCKRKQALVLLVDRFGPAMDKLCDRLSQDFSAGPTRAKGWIYLQLELSNDRLEAAAFDHFSASTTYPARKEGLDAYRLASDLRAHRDEACSRISSLAAALKKAHAKVVLSLQDGNPAIEDLQELGERASDLKSAMELLLHH